MPCPKCSGVKHPNQTIIRCLYCQKDMPIDTFPHLKNIPCLVYTACMDCFACKCKEPVTIREGSDCNERLRIGICDGVVVPAKSKGIKYPQLDILKCNKCGSWKRVIGYAGKLPWGKVINNYM